MGTTDRRGDAGESDTNDRAVELWGRVIHGVEATNIRILAAIEQEFSLSAAAVQVLLELHRQPGQRAPMALLAQAASFSTGGFTKLADKLSRSGYVSREPSPEDRRVTFLDLTPEGRQAADRLAELTARAHREVFIDVLGEQRAALVAEAMTELSRANAPQDG